MMRWMYLVPAGLVVTLGGCARLNVEVGVLNPALVAASAQGLREEAAYQSLLRNDSTDREAAVAAITRAHVAVLKECDSQAAALLREAAMGKAMGAERTLLLTTADRLESSALAAGQAQRAARTEAYVRQQLLAADGRAREAVKADRAALGQALADREAAYAAVAREVTNAPCTVPLEADMVKGLALPEAGQIDEINRRAAPVREGLADTAEANVRQSAAAGPKSLFGNSGRSLIHDPAAFFVANTERNDWKSFNFARGLGRFGSTDIVIKMNDTAQFTVKGFVFDASKTSAMVGKVGVSAMSMLANAYGAPINVAAGPKPGSDANVTVGTTSALTDARATLARAAATKDAYTASVRVIAASIIGQWDRLGNDADSRKVVNAVFEAQRDLWKEPPAAPK